jgi:hypothetical protein
MGTTTRHFNALMRKNFINWKREPGSATCQLCCPGLLMLILVYVRTRISPTTYTSATLAFYETPQFTIDLATDGSLDIAATQARIAPFSGYYKKPYTVTTDRSSPLNFNPTNCNLTNSWVLPKVASP